MEATTNTFIRWFNSDEIVPSKAGHYTTAETPEATVNGWYTAVFTPTTGG